MRNRDFQVCPHDVETFKTTRACNRNFVHAVTKEPKMAAQHRVQAVHDYGSEHTSKVQASNPKPKPRQEQIKLKLGKVHVVIKNAHEVSIEEQEGRLILQLK